MKKYLFLALFLFCGAAHSAQTVTQPVNFSGGVDYYSIPTEVADNRAVDMQNLVGDLQGGVKKRNGSSRFISQVKSTNSINSLYWASVDVGTGSFNALIMTTADKIYVSTSTSSPLWKEVRRNLNTLNQNFSFTNYNGIVVMTGDALTDPVFQYDIKTDTLTELFDSAVSTRADSVNVYAKFVLARDGHLILANCLDVKDKNLTSRTTYYGSRIYYSLYGVNKISTFTVTRFIDVNTDDGESISGITDKGGASGSTILLYKPSSIMAMNYTIMDLTINGGDISINTVVKGFGCISPKALANIGEYDIVPTRYGLILYNGGAKTRLNLIEEIKTISNLIKPVYERTVLNNTYLRSCGAYYPKKQWYVFSFEDPYYSPSGKANRFFIYDIKTGEWYPQNNILASSFATINNSGDLIYGDSSDGYVYSLDLETRNDDARKEISVDPMDSTSAWASSTIDYSSVIEGTASLRIDSNFSNSYFSSMTKISLINISDWNDRSKVNKDKDYISFKIKTSSIACLSSLRVDFQFEATISSFTAFFSSCSISSNSIILSGNPDQGFVEIKVKLSSFPIPDSWVNPLTQQLPFANILTLYGIRFVNSSISTNTINIDDLRIVGGNDSIIESYYLTKQFNLGTIAQKDWRQLILTMDKPSDSSLKVDIFTDFGYFANTKSLDAALPKEIFQCSYKGNHGITRLNSYDFSVIDSTSFPNPNIIDYMNGVANKDYVFANDKVLNRILMLDRKDLSVIISSFGSLGSGTTNFNNTNQMSLVGNNLFVTDNFNNRLTWLLVKNRKLNLVKTYGELGLGTTNFYSISGVTADLSNIFVLDDGLSQITKYSYNFEYVASIKIDANTIGKGVLTQDSNYIYAAYNKIVDKPYFTDVVLEKRNKGDLSLVQRVTLRPLNVVEQSTYTLSGDIGILGKYLFIGFTKDLAQTGTYYVQKILKEGFSVVDEYSTAATQFGLIADSESYQPTLKNEKINLESRNGSYIQFKYYDKNIDNIFKLYNYSFAVDPKSYEEQTR